jgi:hypothetical protein
VSACAEETEDEDGYSKEKQAAHLATAFGLPANCC